MLPTTPEPMMMTSYFFDMQSSIKTVLPESGNVTNNPRKKTTHSQIGKQFIEDEQEIYDENS